MKMRVFLKSGADFTVDVEEFTTKRNQMSGELTSMNWTTPENWKAKLHTLQLEEVAAVVVLSK